MNPNDNTSILDANNMTSNTLFDKPTIEKKNDLLPKPERKVKNFRKEKEYYQWYGDTTLLKQQSENKENLQ